jgi:hypothetical protein
LVDGVVIGESSNVLGPVVGGGLFVVGGVPPDNWLPVVGGFPESKGLPAGGGFPAGIGLLVAGGVPTVEGLPLEGGPPVVAVACCELDAAPTSFANASAVVVGSFDID